MPRPTSIFRLALGSRSTFLPRRPVRLALLVLCVAALVPATASAAITGAISGTVTNAVTHAPLSGIGVGVFDSGGNRVEVTTTDDTGAYTLASLPSASYHVLFAEENHIGYLSQWYGGNDFASSAAVAVQAPLTTSGIDAALQQTGTIGGSVSDASTHDAVVGAEVDVYDSSGNVLTYTCTGADGSYSVSGLSPGQYRVGFLPTPGIASLCHGANYLAAYYNGASTFASAQLVQLTSGGTVGGVNGALAVGGQLTGAVSSAADHSALDGITVTAYDNSGNAVLSTCSTADGSYDLMGLPSGDYRVGYLDDGECAGAPTGYQTAYYSGPGSVTDVLGGALAISVTAGQSADGIDAALGQGGGTTSTTTTSSTSSTSSSSSSTSSTSSTSSSSSSSSTSSTDSTQSSSSTSTTSSTTTTLIIPTTSSTSTATGTSTTQSSSSTTQSGGGSTGGTPPGGGSGAGSGSGPRLGSGGSGAGKPKPTPKPVVKPPRCTMKVTGTSVLLHAPKHRRRGARKPAVGTVSVTVTCDGTARLTLSAAVYELPRGRHSRLATFGASARGSAAVKRKLTLVLHLSRSALTGLGHRATTSALLSLKAAGAGGTATSTLAVGRLHGTG